MTSDRTITSHATALAAILLATSATALHAQTATATHTRIAIAPTAAHATLSSFAVPAKDAARSYRITVREDGQAEVSPAEATTPTPAAAPAPATDPAPEPDPQTKDDLMEGLDRIGANAKERNEVNLDKNTMALAGQKNGRYADLGSKMDLITVRNYEFAQKGQYQKSDLDALRRKLEGNGWSFLVRNEGEGETNDIAVKSAGDGLLSDMVIVNTEPREVSVVHIRGRFRMDDLKGAMGAAMRMGSTGSLSMSSHGAAAPPAPPAPPAHP